MYDIFAKIALGKIEEAIKNGEFDNLPGKGKPVNLDYLDLIPPEMRPAYTVLRNSGCLPEEVDLLKEIASLKQELKSDSLGEEKKKALIKKLRELELKYNLAIERTKGTKRFR
ncbi:MAG: DUF1992 domain-containing protein [Peptococcaceae bacterium]|nr:DUF1992 domain-containing protein [Peptococcaceae bacterium]